MDTKILTTHFENSSHILRADYDTLMNTLKVYFKSGGVYTYVDVPQKIYENFSGAESAGRFHVTKIKNQYDFLKDV